MCKILRAVEGMLLGYNDLQAALRGYGYLGQDRQSNRGFFSGIVRGVSDPREGRRSLVSYFDPDWCAACSYISEARGR